MKPSEKVILDLLRKSTLSHLSDFDFTVIEKAVEKDGILNLTGVAASVVKDAVKKAKSVKNGDMVSWNSSGGSARGKVVRVVSSGKINVPDSSFSIAGTEDDPAVLIQLYRDGKPTETQVGHKMSTLRKSESVEKHGSHDQDSHGAWSNGKYDQDDSEGEDSIEPKNQKLSDLKDDSEGEFEDLDYDDPRHMDDMDLRPYGGAAFSKTWAKATSVAKHGGGSHDQESHGAWAGNGAGGGNSGTQASGKKPAEGKNYEAMMRDYDKMEAKWRKKLNEKPYDPENPEYGDPQDLASTDFYRKYGVYPDEVPM
jgi:hypothetical protein